MASAPPPVGAVKGGRMVFFDFDRSIITPTAGKTNKKAVANAKGSRREPAAGATADGVRGP
jgi:hypothetical protein